MLIGLDNFWCLCIDLGLFWRELQAILVILNSTGMVSCVLLSLIKYVVCFGNMLQHDYLKTCSFSFARIMKCSKY